MKKYAFITILSLFMGSAFLFSSCEKEPLPDAETPTEEISDESDTDDSDETFSILGHWRMVQATQVVSGNVIDITNFYTQDFQLIFEEDGTLITTNGVSETPMQWTMEGDQLSFIQATGMEPVIYTVRTLTAQNLVIENGTDIVTTMEFQREQR